MPGALTSTAHFNEPSTLGGMSYRCGDWPTILSSCTVLTLAAPVVASFCLVAAVVFGAYGTALALVGTQLPILPLRLYSLISETGSDFPAAAALALLITAVCSTIITTGEWVGAKHERHL